MKKAPNKFLKLIVIGLTLVMVTSCGFRGSKKTDGEAVTDITLPPQVERTATAQPLPRVSSTPNVPASLEKWFNNQQEKEQENAESGE